SLALSSSASVLSPAVFRRCRRVPHLGLAFSILIPSSLSSVVAAMDSGVMIPLKGLSIPQQKRVFDLLARQDLKKLLEIVSANLALELLRSIIQIASGPNQNDQDPLYRQMLDNAAEFQLCSGAATQFITLARQDVVGHILDIEAYPTRSNRNWTR
ncbi:unnamed protein product, partial [Linum tenue]